MISQKEILKKIAWIMLQPDKEWYSLSELSKLCKCDTDNIISLIEYNNGLFTSEIITTKNKKVIAKFGLKNSLLLRTVYYTNQMCGNNSFKFVFSEKELNFLKALSDFRFSGKRSISGLSRDCNLPRKKIQKIFLKLKESNILLKNKEDVIYFTNIGKPLYGMILIHLLFFDKKSDQPDS